MKNQIYTALLSLVLLAALACGIGRGAALGPLRLSQDREAVTVLSGERPVLEYRLDASPRKPFVSKLFSPSGVQVLRDSPADHKHHHALMFALAVNKVDFWAEKDGAGGIEKHRSVQISKESRRSGARAAGFVQELDWADLPSGDSLLAEQRRIEVLEGEDIPATLLTWRSRLVPARGRASVELTGSHYFGLGMRFVESMDRGGRFFNSEGLEGELVRGSERLAPARWSAYSAAADGKNVTVAIFDHPANLRHPARMFTMSPPFAYMAATLNLWKEPFTLQAAKPLELAYGVALWDGAIEPAQDESLCRRWVKLARR